MDRIEQEIQRYNFNLFAYPDDYFETHTAKELGISEEARLELVELKRENSNHGDTSDKKARAIKELLDLFSDVDEDIDLDRLKEERILG